LGYLVWRDTKRTLVLFIENRDVTSIIGRAAAAITEHPACRQAVGPASPGERRNFVLLRDSDPARQIKLALLPFVIG
jgi:hypothetical protein